MGKVNENVYGAKADWLYASNKAWGGSSEVDKELSYATANFGAINNVNYKTDLESNSYKSTLSTAHINGKLEINTPIDNSICPIGTDNNFTGVQTHLYTEFTGENYQQELVHIDYTETTNHPLFFYNMRLVDNNSVWQDHSTMDLPPSIDSDDNNTISWGNKLNEPQTSTIYGGEVEVLVNEDRKIQPITYLPIKRTVWCVIVTVCKDVNVIDPETAYFDLDYYTGGSLDSLVARNEYPYILNISVGTLHQTKDVVNSSNPRGVYLKDDRSTQMMFSDINPQFEKFTMYNDDNQELEFDLLKYENRDWNRYFVTYVNNDEVKELAFKSCVIFGGNDNLIGYYNGTWDTVYGTPEYVGFNDDESINIQYSRIAEHWGSVEKFREFALSQCAYLGMFFTGSLATCLSGGLLDDNMYLGIIDAFGMTHGEYSNGKDNENQKQWNWNDMIADTDYDPNIEPDIDENEYDERTVLPGSLAPTGFNTFTTTYAIDTSNLNTLRRFLYNYIANPEKPVTEEQLSNMFLTTNPIDCVVGLMSFPINFGAYQGAIADVALGNQKAEVSGVACKGKILANGYLYIDGGTCSYYPQYKDFRDYEPYCNANLLIPYCGCVAIKPSEFMGHDISTKYLIDLVTGACLCLIYRDELCVDSISGQMGTSIGITGVQQADYLNSLYTAITNTKIAESNSITANANASINRLKNASDMGSTLLSPSTWVNPIGGVLKNAISTNERSIAENQANRTSAIEIAKTDYDLNHVTVPFKSVGVSSPITSMMNEQACRLVLNRPKMLDEYNSSIYGSTIGFACNISGTVGSFRGYTEFASVKLNGINCTSEEKTLINNLLLSGVYL